MSIKDKAQKDRRSALRKAVIVGGAALALPHSWKTPVIRSVILPAHATTSGVIYTVVSASGSGPNSSAGAVCSFDGIGFSVVGTVAASNGADLAGVSLTIEYSNETDIKAKGPGPVATDSFTTLVQPGNTYDSGDLVAIAGNPPGWDNPLGNILVRFTDQATYGTSFATTTTECLADNT